MSAPPITDTLRLKQGKGQPIRDDGPQSHILTKKGTPTMGGLMILSGLFVATPLSATLRNPFMWIVLGVTFGYAAIGFYDDFLKVTKQSHKGFSGRLRLVTETMIALVATTMAMRRAPNMLSPSFGVPFLKDVLIPLGFAFPLVASFVVVGAGNAVNLTDG